jgi:hypothetical protein
MIIYTGMDMCMDMYRNMKIDMDLDMDSDTDRDTVTNTVADRDRIGTVTGYMYKYYAHVCRCRRKICTYIYGYVDINMYINTKIGMETLSTWIRWTGKMDMNRNTNMDMYEDM